VPDIDRDPLARLAAMEGVASAMAAARDGEAASRLRDLATLLGTQTTAPALVVAAVAHAEVQAVGPFVSHNGLVARALERLLLVERGVDAKSLAVPEAGHLALRAEYESNLRGYRSGGSEGVHSWLLYAAEAYAASAEASPLNA
jgi:Fic family protein